MNIRKLQGNDQQITLLIDIENHREKLIFMSIFYDTYNLQTLANNGQHLLPEDDKFSHEEIKAVADKIYVAI
ncbi:MAG: hypothetical protein EOO85_30595 [Pedobacter sp.]|nr:MAG: hypothetical protein EOO85_30595 [Pedobacter sp.]